MRNDHTEKSLRDEIEKSERSLKIFNDTKKALQTEERFVNFFKGYNQSSVESFITSYAQQKAFWYSYSDSVAKNKMHERSIYRNNAVNALKEIYVKKLFDLKCRWVAGEMDLPGVETSHNFHRLEKKPELGTAIKPITEEEVNCYIAFLDYKKENPEKDYDDPGTNLALHFYHQHKSTALEDFGDEEYIPVWFMFYDRRFGTDELLKLPTTRVDMECDLHDIWLEHIFPKTLTEEQLKTVTPHLNRTKRMELKQDKQKREAYFAEQNRQYEEQKKNSPKYEHMSTYDRKKMKTLVALIETPEVQKYY
ncbi:MAG TPA: hypothetical protein VI757_09300, partial [Bacteroidia bacterium]|nr:hypothetical protein [Bacteroidia bacterium]